MCTYCRGAIRQKPCFLPTLLPSSHIGGGLHSLATTVLLTECSIEYSIGLLPILHTVPSDRMPSHNRHVSQPPSPIWIITVAPPPPADTHRLLPSSHTDPSSSASTGSPAGSLAATDSYRVLTLTRTVALSGPLPRSMPSAVAVAILRGRLRHPVRADRRPHRAAEHHPVDHRTACRPGIVRCDPSTHRSSLRSGRFSEPREHQRHLRAATSAIASFASRRLRRCARVAASLKSTPAHTSST